MGYGHTRLTATDTVTLIRVITSPIQNEIEWPNVQVDAFSKIVCVTCETKNRSADSGCAY